MSQHRNAGRRMQAHVNMPVLHSVAPLHLGDAAAWVLQEAGLDCNEGSGCGQ